MNTYRNLGLIGVWTCSAQLTMACVSNAYAQESSESSAAAVERIQVSSRKRDEWILDVPLAVQAFSAQDIEEAGISNLEDLTLFAPGLDFKNQGGNFGGRFLPAIRFRGLTSQTNLPSNQVGSLFVDGIYVLGGAQSIGFEDIERVEVIKGPQAAYFGRSTFGGAINYITRDPSDIFGGKFSSEYSPSFGSHRTSISVEGSIIEDQLTASLSASEFEKGSAFTANDGGRLGEETTNAMHLTLLYTPTDDLRVKFRASYTEDEDTGPQSTAIQFSEFSNCNAGTAVTVLDGDGVTRDTTLAGNLWCGALPEISDGVIVSRNTTFPIFEDGGTAFLPEVDVRDLMVTNSRGIEDINKAPYLDHFGLRRQMTRLSANIEWTLSDEFDLATNLSYNDQEMMSIRDGDNSDGESVYVGSPSFFEDYSGEVRISYDGGGKLRALFGINYYEQKIHAAFSNGVEATNSILFDTGDTPFEIRIIGAQNSTPNDDEIKTLGVFGSIDYEFTEDLGLTLEGRWQDDEVTLFGGTFGDPIATEKLSSSEFLPRAILKWNPMLDMMTYVSYSKGSLPGQFNTRFTTLSAEDKAAVREEIPELQDKVPNEELTSYEIGLKQSLLNGSLNYSTAIYSMTWENMKSAISFLPPGATGFQSAFVSGESKIKGVELESNYVASSNLDFALTVNFTDAKYEDFGLTSLAPLFNLTTADGYKVDGNSLAQFPKWSGSVSGTYMDTLEASPNWDWYTRIDIAHTGKTYTDAYNLTWIDSYQKVNLKLGFKREDLSIELYADNLLDEDGWVSGTGLAFFGEVPVALSTINTLRAAHVTAMQPREIGVRVTLSF